MQRLARKICLNETGWKYAEDSNRLKTKTWWEIFQNLPCHNTLSGHSFQSENSFEATEQYNVKIPDKYH